jgi:hypothetical protein
LTERLGFTVPADRASGILKRASEGDAATVSSASNSYAIRIAFEKWGEALVCVEQSGNGSRVTGLEICYVWY